MYSLTPLTIGWKVPLKISCDQCCGYRPKSGPTPFLPTHILLTDPDPLKIKIKNGSANKNVTVTAQLLMT